MARTVNEKALRIKTLAYGKGYSARVQIGGVRKPVYAATVKELRAKIKAEVEEASDTRRGVDAAADPPPASYNDACERILAVYPSRPSSKNAFENQLARSRARWGSRKTQAISRYEVEVWDAELAEEGLEPITRRRYLAALERVVRIAAEHGWHGPQGRNQLAGITRARGLDWKTVAEDDEPDPFDSWADVFKIAAAFAYRPWGQMVRFCLGLGLRQHEMVVARACDVDLTAGIFTVRRTWAKAIKGTPGHEQELGKTSGSLAPLALTPIAREVLLELQAEGMVFGGDPADWRSSPLLFPDPVGKVTPLGVFRSGAWTIACTKAGIRYRPPKQLRHTFGTLSLVDAGLEHLADVSLALRHSELSTTQRSYVKKVLEMRRAAAGNISVGMPAYAERDRSV